MLSSGSLWVHDNQSLESIQPLIGVAHFLLRATLGHGDALNLVSDFLERSVYFFEPQQNAAGHHSGYGAN
jgi:hypothetical protein